MVRKTLVFFALFVYALAGFSQDTKYKVYLFMGEDCKICQYYTPLINELNQQYSSDSISFQGLFPNRYSNEEGISGFKEKYGVTIPLKREYFGTLTRKFGIEITPEVIIFDTKAEQVIYQGRIDDSYVKIGRRKRVIAHTDLKNALDDLVAGREIQVKETLAVGCFIQLREK